MGTGSAREPSEAEGKQKILDCLRVLRALLDLLQILQQRLRSRIATCEELLARLAAVQATLRAGPASGTGP